MHSSEESVSFVPFRRIMRAGNFYKSKVLFSFSRWIFIKIASAIQYKSWSVLYTIYPEGPNFFESDTFHNSKYQWCKRTFRTLNCSFSNHYIVLEFPSLFSTSTGDRRKNGHIEYGEIWEKKLTVTYSPFRIVLMSAWVLSNSLLCTTVLIIYVYTWKQIGWECNFVLSQCKFVISHFGGKKPLTGKNKYGG